MLIFPQFYFFFSFSICLSATDLDSVVSNPLPVFKFKLQLLSFRVPIKKFPYHSRCELTIMPEECWLLLEHSLIFFFCFLFFLFSFFFLLFFFYSNTSSTQHTPTGKSSTVACLNFTQLCYTHPPRNNQIHDSLAKKKLTIRARKSNNFKWFTAVNFEPTRFNLADLTWFHMKCRFSLGYR